MIFGKNIEETLLSSISRCEDHCSVATAYCKKSAFEKLFIEQPLQSKNKVLIVRWELKDLVMGASDLDVYTLAKSSGWDIYINSDLHAKVYRFDDDTYIGSANLTASGITGNTSCLNLEAISKEKTTNDIEGWFARLIYDSRLLDDELFNLIKEDVTNFENKVFDLEELTYSDKTKKLLQARLIEKLFTNDFIWTENPEFILDGSNHENLNVVHDLQVLSLSPLMSYQDIVTSFNQSKAFLWLRNILYQRTEIYFGELSSLLHDSLQDDPAPYRKTVKILLNNLICWLELCAQDQFIVDKPNRSTRIRLK